ncbi:SNARE domain-containing protein [Botrytis cinerea]
MQGDEEALATSSWKNEPDENTIAKTQYEEVYMEESWKWQSSHQVQMPGLLLKSLVSISLVRKYELIEIIELISNISTVGVSNKRCTPPTIPHTPPLYFLPAHPFSNQISTSNSGAPLRPLRPNHLPLPLDRRPAGPSRFHIRNSSRPLQIWPTNRRSISSSTDDRGDRGEVDDMREELEKTMGVASSNSGIGGNAYNDDNTGSPLDDDYAAEFEHQQQMQMLKQQDEQLDSVFHTVGNLRQQADDMGRELEEQTGMLQEVETVTDRVSGRLQGGMKRMNKLVKENEDGLSSCCIAVLIFVLILLLVLVLIL